MTDQKITRTNVTKIDRRFASPETQAAKMLGEKITEFRSSRRTTFGRDHEHVTTLDTESGRVLVVSQNDKYFAAGTIDAATMDATTFDAYSDERAYNEIATLAGIDLPSDLNSTFAENARFERMARR